MPVKDRTLMWLAGAGLGAAALAFLNRGSIADAAGVVMDDVKRSVFRAVIPVEARPYADVILRVADEQGISPFLIVQLGYRETLWGTSRNLDQLGPGGRGDYGHGYGLMQIDDRTNAAWLAENDWRDPYTNITKGVQILKGKRAFFTRASPVKGLTDGTTVTLGPKGAAARNAPPGTYPDPRPLVEPALTQAAVAAYNTGEGNVLLSLACGVDPDTTTAGYPSEGYSSDVLGRMASLLDRFNTTTAVG